MVEAQQSTVDRFVYSNVLIVGAGTIAVRYHLPRMLSLLRADKVMLYDANPARRDELRRSRRWASRSVVLERLPDRGAFDLIALCTPPRFHADLYFQLEELSSVFLMEKPLTLTAGEARAIARSAAERGRAVKVNLIRRLLPNFYTLKAWWRDGLLGDLREVRCRQGSIFEWQAASGAYFSKQMSGGGVLMDMGPHLLDQLLQLFSELELKEARLDSEPGGIEANCHLDLLGDGRVPVSAWLSRNRNLSDTAVLEFDRGSCRVGLADVGFWLETKAGRCRVCPETSVAPPGDFFAALDALYRECLLRPTAAGLWPEEAVRGVELIEQAYTTARPCQEVAF